MDLTKEMQDLYTENPQNTHERNYRRPEQVGKPCVCAGRQDSYEGSPPQEGAHTASPKAGPGPHSHNQVSSTLSFKHLRLATYRSTKVP